MTDKLNTSSQQFLDITAPEQVDIEIRQDGRVVWVSCEGITVLRICRIGVGVYVNDHRPLDQQTTEEGSVYEVSWHQEWAGGSKEQYGITPVQENPYIADCDTAGAHEHLEEPYC